MLSQPSKLQISVVLCFFMIVVGCNKPTPPTPTPPTPAPTVVSEAVDPPTTEEADEPSAPEVAEAAPKVNAGGEPWGHLKGVFVYDGDPPARSEKNVDKPDCSKHKPIFDESLVVNSENKGLANVVITLVVARGEDPPPSHPSYEETANASVTLDNNKCAFVPHVTLLRTTQALVIKNSDDTGHNTKIDPFGNPGFNQIVPAKGQIEYRAEKTERVAAPVACSIHTWMTAYLLIKDHPYSAVTDADGRFEISNLPVGEWEFSVWQETAGNLGDLTLTDGLKTSSKGRFTIEIRSGDNNDLGEISVPPSQFED